MKSIRGRLLFTLLTGLAVVLVGGGVSVYLIQRQSLVRQFDADLRSRVLSLASLVKFEPEGLIFESSDAPASTIAETYFEIRTQQDKVLKRSANLNGAAMPSRSVRETEMAFGDVHLPDSAHARAVWYVFKPRVDPDDWPGQNVSDILPETLQAVVALDRSSIDQALTALIIALATVGGLAALTAMLVVTFGVRWALTPLDRLGRQLATISANTISSRIDGFGAPHELKPMYRELNAMLDRVENSLRRERLFVNAAAHEFRTPLAELRTTAEIALKWPDERHPRLVLEEIIDIGRDMERLIESLLLVSRAHACVALPGGPYPWASLVRSCIHRAHATIERKRLRVDVVTDGSAGDTDLKDDRPGPEVIVRNLVENAVHYTPENGRISIRVDNSSNGAPALLVENAPVVLTQDELAHLFDPFWRLDRARGDRSHAGLGLTVVREVAEVLGFRVDAALEGDRLQMRVVRTG